MNSKGVLLAHVAKKYNIDLVEEAKEIEHICPNLTDLIKKCCRVIGAEFDYITTRSRKRALAQQRQCIMTAIYELDIFSQEEVGKEFSRDHSTVIHSIQTVSDMIETKNPVFIKYMSSLREYINTISDDIKKHHPLPEDSRIGTRSAMYKRPTAVSV